MTDLLVFLRARLDDDKRVARAAVASLERCGPAYMYPDGHSDEFHDFSERFSEHRMLAEVDAKRLILDAHPLEGPSKYVPFQYCGTCQDLDGIISGPAPCPTQRALTLPYADHPDYDESWKP